MGLYTTKKPLKEINVKATAEQANQQAAIILEQLDGKLEEVARLHAANLNTKKQKIEGDRDAKTQNLSAELNKVAGKKGKLTAQEQELQAQISALVEQLQTVSTEKQEAEKTETKLTNEKASIEKKATKDLKSAARKESLKETWDKVATKTSNLPTEVSVKTSALYTKTKAVLQKAVYYGIIAEAAVETALKAIIVTPVTTVAGAVVGAIGGAAAGAAAGAQKGVEFANEDPARLSYIPKSLRADEENKGPKA